MSSKWILFIFIAGLLIVFISVIIFQSPAHQEIPGEEISGIISSFVK